MAPDVFVVVGAPKHLRMNYKLWEEPGPPDFVLEVVASARTRREAQGPKRALYARLGIREYWLFDPVGRYLAPPLQGFRLHGGDYHPLPARPVGGAPVLRSDALRLDLRDARPVGRHAHGSSAHSGGCFGRAIFDPRRRCAASLDQEVT